jgi:bifunctional non-homologous end joining protein LigD
MSVRAPILCASVGFVAPCLPSLADNPPKGAGWIHEIKHDGFRMMVRRNGVGRSAIHENGYDWTDRYSLICGPAQFCLMAKRSIATRMASLYAFDLIKLDGRDLRREPIETRAKPHW